MNPVVPFLSLLLILASCSIFKTQGPRRLPKGLQGALEASERAPENVERDRYQHPHETLAFFGIKPTMAVVEVSPGAGYFTEILAPYLSREGQLILAVPRMPHPPPAVLVENERKLQEILLRYHEVQNKAKLIPFEPVDKRNRIQKEQADAVLSFNTVHNWVAKNTALESFQFFYDLLKKGGTLGIVQHRIRPGQKRVPKSGYLYEKEVIALAKAAGFRFVQSSEINANPKDTADYPEGVWTLPPYYRLGNEDRDRYESIGESDRMTLRFVKP